MFEDPHIGPNTFANGECQLYKPEALALEGPVDIENINTNSSERTVSDRVQKRNTGKQGTSKNVK